MHLCFRKKKKFFSLHKVAKVSNVLNSSNIATTVEKQVKVLEGPPVKKF